MANKPLQSIKFPGLSDTYTVPQVDNTLAVTGAAADAKKVGDEISNLKDDLNNKNGEVFGGNIKPLFELGSIWVDDNWQYVNDNRRIRTKQNNTIHLQVGSTIELSDYNNAKFSVGWKVDGVKAGYATNLTSRFTANEEGDYAIVIISYPETAQSSPDALASLVIINSVPLKTSIYQDMMYNIGNIINENNTFPGFINSVGWYSREQTARTERVTDFIPVTSGEEWTAYLRSKDNFRISFLLYSQAKDGNSAFLEQRTHDEYSIDGEYKCGIVTEYIPEGCTFIRVYYYTDGLESYYLFNSTTRKTNDLLGIKGYYGLEQSRKDTSENIDALNKELITAKVEIFGGNIYPMFELGNVYFDDNWRRVPSNTRIRFLEGNTIHLQKGSTISLNDYSNARFNVGWKINDVVSGYSGWITETFTTTVEADYSIAVMSYPETAQSSPDALASLVIINSASLRGSLQEDISNSGAGIISSDKEINLTEYTAIPYNLESGRWDQSNAYKSVLIPLSDLSFSTDFIADTYKCSFAYLKSDTITVGERPDLCDGTAVENIAAGNSVHRKVPEDCKYLYVYITTGNQFGNYHVINKALKYDFDIVRQNAKGIVYINDVDQVLRTIKHRHDGNVNTFTGTNWSDNLLVLAQITDVHSDPSSYSRFIAFLNRNTDTINAGIVSGDLVDHGADSQYELMIGCESALLENAKLIKCLGNHEMQSTKTQAETYVAYGLDTNTGKSYYYVDYVTQKIRIICLDQYDTDSTDTNIKTKTAHYSQAQIDWLINTLKDAITNEYAVIIVYHSCNEVGFPIYNDSGFCQDRKYNMFPSPTSGTIISDIVDAFQNALTLNETYTASDISVTLTVNTTFTDKGTFVCYICGHEHIDYVGYSTKYPNQLICIAQGGVVESQSRPESEAHWQSMYDTPRVAGTSTQDSFNVYGIDTVNRFVKIVKIGSTLTDKFVPRSFATFRF